MTSYLSDTSQFHRAFINATDNGTVIVDQSSNATNGTGTGNEIFGCPTGKYMVHLDGGGSDRVTVTSLTAANMDGDQTVFFWVWNSEVGTSSQGGRVMFAHGGSTAIKAPNFIIWMEAGAGGPPWVMFYLDDDDNTKTTYTKDSFTDDESTQGKWMCMAYIRSGDVWTQYLDGKLIPTDGANNRGTLTQADTWASTAAVAFGYWAAVASRSWHGYMDDMLIFNKALTAADIRRLMRDTWRS